MKKFNLLASKIENLDLKLEGKLPVDRDELFALVNSWGRYDWCLTSNKDGYEIKINSCKKEEEFDLSKLDVSQIKDFNKIFYSSNFNGDISKWDVSNATSMAYMFANTKNFNSPLDNWNTSLVTSMEGTFFKSENFNQDLNSWDVSNVIFMNNIFSYTINFNLPLNSWNISNVKTIRHMFSFAQSFNQPLDNWETSKVTNMAYMFSYATNFNQNLNSWNISKVTNMDYMFSYSKSFNQAILWDLSDIQSCNSMFYNTIAFRDRFNKGQEILENSKEINNWLKANRELMKAIEIKDNKSDELDEFVLNINNQTINKR